MAIDTPARIAILGAGPIGLEAALYARFLGYDVDLFEQGQVADNVCRWGHVRMFSPFGMNRSTLGAAALRAQDEARGLPADDALLTGQEWVDHYLLPLSQTDLLKDHLHTQTTVVAVTRPELFKGEALGEERRGESAFRILVRDASGQECDFQADAVIDTTGVFAQPNWLGPGGAPAIGEIASRDNLEYHVPDVLGRQRGQYCAKRTLVVGGGYSAATTIAHLAELHRADGQTRVTWVTRKESAAGQGPMPRIPQDRLPERDQLAAVANAAVAEQRVTHWGATQVKAIQAAGDHWQVTLTGSHAGEFEFDQVVANVGYRPNRTLYAELQVHECYASEGPMKLAAALLGSSSIDCLDQTAQGAPTLITTEPDFYILGAKSYGRNSSFLVQIGLDQIRELFTIIGDRADLDLYKNAGKLLG